MQSPSEKDCHNKDDDLTCARRGDMNFVTRLRLSFRSLARTLPTITRVNCPSSNSVDDPAYKSYLITACTRFDKMSRAIFWSKTFMRAVSEALRRNVRMTASQLGVLDLEQTSKQSSSTSPVSRETKHRPFDRDRCNASASETRAILQVAFLKNAHDPAHPLALDNVASSNLTAVT